MNYTFLQKIFLTLSVINFFSYYPASARQNYTYVLKVHDDPRDPVHITCTYKGCVIDLNDGIDFLPETDFVTHFSVLITAEHPKVSNGTVSHLERIPDVACLWYDISWSKEGTKTVWAIEQKEATQIPVRIPHDTLIICYPPEFIEKLDDKTAQESSTIIHLPTIILKKDLSDQERKRRDDALTRSILARVEVNASLTPSKLIKKGNSIKKARVA